MYVKVKTAWPSCLDILQEMGNPLRSLILKDRVSYKCGGIFTLRFIKVALRYVENIYLDYDIMIHDIPDQEDYQKLLKIQEMSMQNLDEGDENVTVTNLDDIKHILTGVGRVVQYSCQSKDLLGTPQKRSFELIYEGQFSKGRGEGMGVLIYP